MGGSKNASPKGSIRGSQLWQITRHLKGPKKTASKRTSTYILKGFLVSPMTSVPQFKNRWTKRDLEVWKSFLLKNADKNESRKTSLKIDIIEHQTDRKKTRNDDKSKKSLNWTVYDLKQTVWM